MKKIAKIVSMAGLAFCGSAHALTCSVTATSIPLTTVYTSALNTDTSGTISVTCTKVTPPDDNRPWIYVSVDEGEPPAGRAMTRQNGPQTLNYTIARNSANGAPWTTARGVTYTTGTAGGVLYRMANNGSPQTQNFPYYFRVPSGQVGAPAGIYGDQLITVTVRLSDNAGLETGTILQSTVFSASASIRDDCYVSGMPFTLLLNYVSFSATPVTDSKSFQVSCTNLTPYTLSLDAVPPPAINSVAGTAVGLNYSLALSATAGTGTSAPQSYNISGSIAAGQPGTCAGASCTAQPSHTVYVGF
jgi:spore coat protein U-like protein